MRVFFLILAVAFVGAILLFLLRRRSSYDVETVGMGVQHLTDDDPIMEAAIRRARESLPTFRSLWPSQPEAGMVKFAFTTDTGAVEFLWAEVNDLKADRYGVTVVQPPESHQGPFDPLRTVLEKDVADWQFALPDGTIRGAFTNKAVFDILRRDGQPLPEEAEEFESRLVDC